MAGTPKILIVSPDPNLRREFDAALPGAAENAAVVHSVATHRDGAEAVRNHRPDLVFVEMGRDFRFLQAFAAEVADASPETAVAAVFSPELFGHDLSESAVLIAALRAGVRDFVRRPVSSTDLGQLLDRLLRPAAPRSGHLGCVVAFVSNKGGVGKSTMSVNVACGLALRHPGRVLLIDLSLQMGVCASMLDLKPPSTLTDAARERDRLDETLLRQLAAPHPTGLHLLGAPADAVEASAIDEDLAARILTLGRRAYDFVIVDSFPLLDSVMMTVLDHTDQAYVVLESLVPTVLGGARFLKTLSDLGYPKERLRVVLNRYLRFAGNLSPADVADRLGRKIDYVVPFQRQVLVTANTGRPHILDAGRWFSGFRPTLERIVAAIEAIKPSPRHALGAATRNGQANPQETPVKDFRPE